MIKDYALASGRVANDNKAAGLAPPEPGCEEKVDKTQRTSKKELARQKEREKQEQALKEKEDAEWAGADGAKPEKGAGKKKR